MAKFIKLNESFAKIAQTVNCFYAFFIINEDLYSVHRRHKLFSYDNWPQNKSENLSQIVLTKYIDKNIQNIQNIHSEVVLCNGNDPRVVSDGKVAYILIEGALYEDDRYTLIIFPSMKRVKVISKIDSDFGKNWQPLIDNNELYIVNSISPFKVNKLDTLSGMLTQQYVKNIDFQLNATHDNYSILRGGSNALVANDIYIGWGHATVKSYQHIPYLWKLNNSGVSINFVNIYSFFLENGYGIVDPSAFFEWDVNSFALSVSCSQRDWFHPQWFLNGLIIIDKKELLESQPLELKLDNIHKSIIFHVNDLDCLMESFYDNGGRSNNEQEGCLVCGPSKEIQIDKKWLVELCYTSPHKEDELVGDFDILLNIEGVDQHAASRQIFGTNNKSIRVALEFNIVSEHKKALIQTRVFAIKNKNLTSYFFELIDEVN